MKSLLAVFAAVIVSISSDAGASNIEGGVKMPATKVTGFRFALIYVDQLEPAQAFYEKYLGFEKTADFRSGEIYGKAGNIELWMQEGYGRIEQSPHSTRATVMFGVDSVGDLFKALKKDGHHVVQEAPVEMQPGTFWMQFADPAGNLIDVLGAR